MPRLLLDLTPLRESPAFRRLWVGNSLSGAGAQLTAVAVGLQVYDETGSTFSVGLVGAFALVPLVTMGLYGGAIADTHDRRRVVLVTGLGMLAVAAAFALQAALSVGSVWLLYALVAVQQGCYAVSSAARASIVPRLLPATSLPAANALSSLSMGFALTVGPLLAGVLVGAAGYATTYAVEVALLAVALVGVAALPPLRPEGDVVRAGLSSVLDGLRFLRGRPNLRMTFLVDLSAMVLALPRVLFPAIAAAVLGGGPGTVGVLTAAIAVGTMAAGLLSGPLGGVRRQGLAVLASVAGWGCAVAAFGLVVMAAPGSGEGSAHWLLWPAAACLAVAGACDAVSAVFRSTILQAATPDVLRGRLQGVFLVVVAGGPRLGDMVLGSLASWTTDSAAAVIGGAACVTAVVLLAAAQPGFARYDARHPVP
ncbi:MFS transporter [Motilibacter deserti]|uniref:MFS transporter n=1 Tax=Motilibacter deserti TaxID=2714956 RepID=A0ABX0GZ74_9ACTN|nr:MFS transporter [Motilibacter deserti]